MNIRRSKRGSFQDAEIECSHGDIGSSDRNLCHRGYLRGTTDSNYLQSHNRASDGCGRGAYDACLERADAASPPILGLPDRDHRGSARRLSSDGITQQPLHVNNSAFAVERVARGWVVRFGTVLLGHPLPDPGSPNHLKALEDHNPLWASGPAILERDTVDLGEGIQAVHYQAGKSGWIGWKE
jgi:hypothetical protein